MKRFMTVVRAFIVAASCLGLADHSLAADEEEAASFEDGKLVMFVGFDISGSFKNRPYFKDSIRFAAHYLYAHLHGLGGLARPKSLFVGSIGGLKVDQAKTFFPIQTFQYKNIDEIEKKLMEIFPKEKTNTFTDFNAFFKQTTEFVRNKKLAMKPISIVLFSDGIPDAPKVNGKDDYRSIQIEPLETLSRNVTIRLLYTTAETAMRWQDSIPRKRVRMWTQDDQVMKDWKAKDIMQSGVPFEKQERFFSWVKDNVDFTARVKRVD